MNRINLIKGDLWSRNETGYDLSLGDKSFQILNSKKNAFSVQLIWEGLTGILDATVKIYGSNDGNTFDLLSGTSSVTLDSANDSFSFIKDKFNWKYLSINVVVNGVTGGVLKAILEVKQ